MKRRARLPRSIKLQLPAIRVKQVPRTALEGDHGAWCMDSLTILIADDLSQKEARETLQHEAQHAIQDLTGHSWAVNRDIDEAGVRLGDNVLRPAIRHIDAICKEAARK